MNEPSIMLEDRRDDDLEALRECSANDYCRLCASIADRMVPIYVDEGADHRLENKIQTHLPFLNVQKNDSLPQRICYHCASALLVWDELYESSTDADQKLRSMFEVNVSFDQNVCKVTIEEHDESMSAVDKSAMADDHDVFANDGSNVYLNSAATEETTGDDEVASYQQLEDLPTVEENDDDPSAIIPKEEYIEHHEHVDNSDCAGGGGENDDEDEDNDDDDECDGVNVRMYLEGVSGDDGEDGNGGELQEQRPPQETMCQICATVFKTRYNLLRHFQKRHPEYKMYECDLCRISFPSIDEFKEHLEDKHSRVHSGGGGGGQHEVSAVVAASAVDSKQIRFACDVCGNMYKNKASAMNHLLTHTAKKNVWCQLCDFSCYTKQQLAVHQTKHDKRFVCDICNKRFAQKSQLDVHVKAVHYNERPYSCVLCKKSFKTKGSHDAHMIVHTDTRNYQCPHCDKKCRKRYDLTLHIRTHTGEKPFKCSVCGRGFVQMCDTRKHEMLHFKPGRRKPQFYPNAIQTAAVVNVMDDDE
ncbi:zinc finger protein 300-like isoform X2 [Adelges cooleyi]|uniref:zinc finger protein 300-like isoform X2 n=1 Tax=Adelges cooleyi TaxID=133065 RepID=UPI0021803785|nr:zinc finger protein 300-like isoform X2 [Adelges cooleyi]